MRLIRTLVSVIGLASAAVAASALAAEQSYLVGPFRTVVNETAPDVLIHVGGATSVRAEGAAAALAALDIRVDGDRLVVRTRPGARWPRQRARTTVHVTTPALAAAVVSGSGDMRVDRVSGANFSGSSHGSGNLIVDDLRVGAASLSTHGSGNVQAAGAVQRLEARTTGSGNVDAMRVQARTASVSATGSGNVDALASDEADVVATGSGNAAVTGTRTCRVRGTGSGSVRCG